MQAVSLTSKHATQYQVAPVGAQPGPISDLVVPDLVGGGTAEPSRPLFPYRTTSRAARIAPPGKSVVCTFA